MSLFSTRSHLSWDQVIEVTFACTGVFLLTLIGVGMGVFSRPDGQAASVLISSSRTFGSHTLSLTASAADLYAGTTVSINWSATGFSNTGTAPCVVIDSSGHIYGNGWSSGSYTTSAIFNTTTFTLACAGAGSVAVSIHLTIPDHPTVTINAGAGNSVTRTVVAGTPVTIVANYAVGTGDTLVASAINGNDQTTSVPCATVLPFNSSCWTKPDILKTYTFTPTAVGTYTYYASAKTSSYILYNNYASVNLTVLAACPNGSGAMGACTACNPGYVLNGGTCAIQCPNGSGPTGMCTACNPGYILAGGMCSTPSPLSINAFSATPPRIRSGVATNVVFSWNIISPPASCIISGPGDFTPVTLSPVGTAGTRTSNVTVSQNSVFTLTCGSVKKTLNIGPVPTVQEY